MTTKTTQPSSVSDLCDWIWETHYESTRASPTVRSTLKQIKESLGDVKLDSVSREDVRKFMADRSNDAPSSVRRKVAVLMKMLNEGFAEGYNPKVLPPPRPRKQKPNHICLPAQVERDVIEALAAEGPLYAELAAFLADTGLRCGEALELRWEAIRDDMSAITVVRSKSGGVRSIPLTGRAKKVLTKLRQRPSGCMAGPFCDVDYHPFWQSWRRVRKKLGYDGDRRFTPHALRHTFASRLVQRGVSLDVVMTLMGHARYDQTLEYAHHAPEQMRGAIETLENL